MKYHPDKNKDPDAEKQFVKIGKAYEILSDPEKRKQYNQLGHKNFEEQEIKGGTAGGAGFGGFDFTDFFKQFDESLRFHQRTQGGGGHNNKYNRQNNGQNVFGSDFWDGFGDEDLFGGGGFGGFGGDAFINLQDFGFGGAFGGNPGHQANHHHHQRGNIHSTHRKAARPANKAGGRCKTVTKRIGNTITTYTDCS